MQKLNTETYPQVEMHPSDRGSLIESREKVKNSDMEHTRMEYNSGGSHQNI